MNLLLLYEGEPEEKIAFFKDMVIRIRPNQEPEYAYLNDKLEWRKITFHNPVIAGRGDLING